MPAEARRGRWREALPAVVAADRLRHVPGLRAASVGQLLRLAGTGRTARPEGGRLICREGAAVADLRLLLEGVVAVQEGGGPAREGRAPLALGLEAVLSGARRRETAWAGEGAVLLDVPAHELLGLLAEDPSFVRALFRAVLDGAALAVRVLPARRPFAAEGTPGARTLAAVGVLEASPLFARATPEQLLRLARVAREAAFVPGGLLFDEADPGALYVIAAGEAAAEADGVPALPAGPGDSLGVGPALGGVPRGRARGTASGWALRLDGDALLELLVADTALLQGVYGALRDAARPA
jgi:CRP-like cAMP-binding protein